MTAGPEDARGRRITAVYSITCSDGRRYIGGSVNVRGRWAMHRWDLRRGRHANRKLQEAWTALGEDAFSFAEVERVDRTALRERGQHWIDHFSAAVSGFNLSPTAGSNAGLVAGPETRAMMSALHSGNSYCRGLKRGAEFGAKISAALRKRTIRPETRAKLSRAHSGERGPAAKLNNAAVHAIRARLSDGESRRSIARSFSVAPDTINKIANGKTWVGV